jgi:DNA modification methylase
VTYDRILQGDVLEQLQTLPDAVAHTCVTSPPYWGLRDYGVKGQIGLERTPEEYVTKLVAIFREVRRVLRDDGTLWLNLGDSYAGSGRGQEPQGAQHRKVRKTRGMKLDVSDVPQGLKPKDLVGVPWRVAFALQADGWWLRCDVIWQKPNAMPESVRDRPTRSHEYLFLLAKSSRYYYDAKAIAEPLSPISDVHYRQALRANRVYATKAPYRTNTPYMGRYKHEQGRVRSCNDVAPQNHPVVGGTGSTRNARSVWTIPTRPYAGAHFATFPVDLISPCIKAGSPEGGTVLDPFMGSGTTAYVARELGRRYLGVELNPRYIKLAEERLAR